MKGTKLLLIYFVISVTLSIVAAYWFNCALLLTAPVPIFLILAAVTPDKWIDGLQPEP